MLTARRLMAFCGMLSGLVLVLTWLAVLSPSWSAWAGSAQRVDVEATLVTGSIGGYQEAVEEVAFAVEENGRVHVLWTGKLNPHFDNYSFYSTSVDGINWTPYQILNSWRSYQPSLAVDNVHKRAHLVYGTSDGIVHRISAGGTLSAPEVVVEPRPSFLPDFPLPSGGIGSPAITVAEDSGFVYLVWREGYYTHVDARYPYRYRTWHAYWDGSAWTTPQWAINDEDTFYSSIASSPDGRVMLAWFQRWEQSLGDTVNPGDPIVPRTAYGTTAGSYGLRQATHELYPVPERDESILLAYAPGTDTFVIASAHAMWPGHSRVYRYSWQNGAWSGPLDVVQNSSGLALPTYVGAAADQALIRYVYSDGGVTKMRTEVNGVLNSPQPLADYLSARGYSGTPVAFFTDASGELHSVVVGVKDGVSGFYYVRP
jgi:hypothetical protein